MENVTRLSVSDILTHAKILPANKGNMVAVTATNWQCIHKEHTGDKVGEARVFKGQCYQCGGPHMVQFCKERRGIVYYCCGRKGHMMMQCNQGNDRRAVAPAATPSME